MIIKQIKCVFIVSLLACNLQAQLKTFDPFLDPACKVQPVSQLEEWKGCYMWYPGQLSAHMQKQLKKESDERCTYVGYPGTFNMPIYQSFFKKTVTVKKEQLIKWHGNGEITCYINGEKQGAATREYTLKPGKVQIVFEIKTDNRLPCLIVDGEGIISGTSWEVSLDNVGWNKVESNVKYNKPAVQPDDRQEKVVEIPPYKYTPLINADITGDALSIGKNGCAVIDFKHLEVGMVKLSVKGQGKITFNVGESIAEVLNKVSKDNEQKAIPVFELDGSLQQITLPERALRYLAVECDGSCVISSTRFDAILWPVEHLMEFESSDESLNDLWKAASATLHTAMHNFYLDGIKRDYLPWSMDAVESSLAGDYLFGDEQVSRNGLSIALMPPKPEISDFGIIDYPLHALIGFKHDYLRYGKIETSLLYKERIVQMMKLYESILDENGFLTSRPEAGFIPGWATKMGPSGNGTPSYGQILLYLNFDIGAYFARLWGEKELANHYEAKAKSLKSSIIKHFWDEDKKAFINGYLENGEKDERISHHAQYWAILADIFPKDYYDNLFENILPEIPFYKDDISFEKGYEFLAYTKAGRTKDALIFLNEVWGDWLSQGHTRFPENFSPKASREEQLVFYGRPFGLSLCHGGNGVAPVVVVLNGVLGFSQSDKNISEYYINPQLLHLDWVKGRIPVKEGFISINVDKDRNCSIEIPNNCIVHVGDMNDKKTFRKKGVYSCKLRK